MTYAYRMLKTKRPKPKNPLLNYFVGQPIIWLMVFPVMMLDIFLELYHRVCFPIFGIQCVRRSEYIRVLDRGKLPYLSFAEKLGCMYCGYVNGWFHYASVIAGRTENHFCAIMHLEERGYIPSEHEKSFAKYGDEAALRKRYATHNLKYGGKE